MYIEFGPLPKTQGKPQRFAFALKVGKGKIIVKSPDYSSRATARTKAMKMVERLTGEVDVYEVEEVKA